MSSFTHWLEKEVLDEHIKKDGLYMGLSRTAGNRQGDFAVWGDDGDGGKEIAADGIDEPGQGWVYDENTSSWVTEASLNLADAYSRQLVNAADWHAVEVVLGAEGDSELRLSSDVSFTEAGTNEDWGTITHFFIVDNITVGAGNILAWGTMPDSVKIVEGMTAKIWGNTIVVRMTD